MTFYLILLLIILLLIILYQGSTRGKKIILFMMGFILVVVAGLRFHVGTDYSVYMRNYQYYKVASISGLRYAGVYIVGHLAKYIRDDYATWFFLMSVITVGLSMYAINKYSYTVATSILLYLFLGCWHNSFNVVKQCAAIAIILVGQKFLFEKKFFYWMVICIIASTFHISALLMIPVYFLVTREINIKQIVLISAIGIIIALSYEVLFNVMKLLKNLDELDVSQSVVTRGVNTIRVCVNFAPVLLAFMFYKTNTDVRYKVWTNFSILNAVLYLASMKSVYLTRFCLYTDVFNMFFIPCAIRHSGFKFNRKLIWTSCMVLYMMFWLYDLSKGSTTSTFHWIFERNI